MINILKFLVFLGVGVGILYYVYYNQNIAFQENCALEGIPPEECSLAEKVLDDFRGVNYFWILMVLTAFTLSNVSRAYRWRMLLQSLGYKPRFGNAFMAVLMNYFANLFLPRIGEVVRAGTITRFEKIPLEKVIGTVVVGRILDVICLLIVTGITLLLEYDKLMSYFSQGSGDDVPDESSGWLLWLGLAASIFGVLFFLFRKQIQATRFYKKIVDILKGFVEGLRTIMRLERPWVFILHSVNVWVLYFMMNYICLYAFMPTAHLGPGAGLMVFVYGSLGIVIPSPGGMGTYQWLVVQALALYGIGQDDAFSFANILFFSVQIGCNVFLGLLTYLYLPFYNQNYEPALPTGAAAPVSHAAG